MKTRRTPLIVGLVLALGTGLLLLNFLTQAHRGTSTAQMRSVVIALKEIPARAQITPEMVASGSRVADQVDPDALADSHMAIGKMALITIPVGSTLTASKVVTPAALALPARLRDGLRAVSISIDKVKGVSGLVQPGDRVDVIAVSSRDGNQTPQASTILRAVLVLALGNQTETASATPAPDNGALTTVTLAVTPQQANLLALGDVYTTLRLALRSSNEPLRSYPTEPIALGAPDRPLAAPPVIAPAVAVPGVPVAIAPRRPLGPYVQVIDGDQAEPRPDPN
jgi:pilus assembly protein CpaB